jgi:hypothetical protein
VGVGGADTLKFNLHIIGRAKKGCEFNQKRSEFKICQKHSQIVFFQICEEGGFGDGSSQGELANFGYRSQMK